MHNNQPKLIISKNQIKGGGNCFNKAKVQHISLANDNTVSPLKKKKLSLIL